MKLQFTKPAVLLALALIAQSSPALAKDIVPNGGNTEGTFGASLSTGSAGAGFAFDGHVENRGPTYLASPSAVGDLSIGVSTQEKPGTARAIGNVGGYMFLPFVSGESTPGLIIGDPMILHSNGVHQQVGGSPFLAVGFGIRTKHGMITASPRAMGVRDTYRDLGANVLGGQVTLDSRISQDFAVHFAAQIGRATTQGLAPKGVFWLGKVGLDYRPASFGGDAAVFGSAEVSDLNYGPKAMTSDGKAAGSDPAVTVTTGIKAVF